MSRPLPIGLAIAVLVVALDQLSKWWVLDIVMDPYARIVEVTPFFNLVLTWNTGVSFGMFSGMSEWMPYLLSLLALGICGVLVSWLAKAGTWWAVGALGMILGGAVGNVVDRLRFGAVVDFLDFHMLGWHFWAFNVADAAISTGVVLLVIDGLFGTHETS